MLLLLLLQDPPFDELAFPKGVTYDAKSTLRLLLLLPLLQDPPFDELAFSKGVTYDATPAAGSTPGCVQTVRRAWEVKLLEILWLQPLCIPFFVMLLAPSCVQTVRRAWEVVLRRLALHSFVLLCNCCYTVCWKVFAPCCCLVECLAQDPLAGVLRVHNSAVVACLMVSGILQGRHVWYATPAAGSAPGCVQTVLRAWEERLSGFIALQLLFDPSFI
jgi:hypothetical protein